MRRILLEHLRDSGGTQDQWRRQDFYSSGANVGRANNVCIEARSAEFARNAHRGAKRRVCAKRAPRREAPSPREARNQGAKRRVKSGGRVWGGGSVSPSPRKFLKF